MVRDQRTKREQEARLRGHGALPSTPSPWHDPPASELVAPAGDTGLVAGGYLSMRGGTGAIDALSQTAWGVERERAKSGFMKKERSRGCLAATAAGSLKLAAVGARWLRRGGVGPPPQKITCMQH